LGLSRAPKTKKMFGNKKKETNSGAKKGMMPAASSHSLNSLVKGTVVEGTVKSESDIRVDGTIKGNLNCDAKVIIGPSGFIEGDVRCANAVIEGRFEGTLAVVDVLDVRETAEVHGDIKTNKLVVQPGAVFNVVCKMGSQSNNFEKNLANNLAKSTADIGVKEKAS